MSIRFCDEFERLIRAADDNRSEHARGGSVHRRRYDDGGAVDAAEHEETVAKRRGGSVHRRRYDDGGAVDAAEHEETVAKRRGGSVHRRRYDDGGAVDAADKPVAKMGCGGRAGYKKGGDIFRVDVEKEFTPAKKKHRYGESSHGGHRMGGEDVFRVGVEDKYTPMKKHRGRK